MVPADSHRISRVPRYSGFRYASDGFAQRAFTCYGTTFQRFMLTIHLATSRPYNPSEAGTSLVWALPRSLATTGGITFCFLFLEVLRCFSSLRSPHYNCVMMTVLQTDGLSHSEIRGSKDICSYPRLIAAYHVLHRLHEPRHPPCALIHFLGSGHQHGRSYFQLYPDKQKCQENFFVEFYSTVSCVNMSKISWCQPGSKRRVRD